MLPRPGKTIIEVLVAVGVGTLLLGLVMSAVVHVRSVATRMKCQNNHRQVALALQEYAADNGHLPYYRIGLDGWQEPGRPAQPRTPHAAILPYLERRRTFEPYTPLAYYHFISTFICPADPNLTRILDPQTAAGGDETSVAMNYQVFRTRRNPTFAAPDGLSNTLATAEHYAWCGRFGGGTTDEFFFGASWPEPGMGGSPMPAHFAGSGYGSPVTVGNPPVSLASDKRNARSTFQRRPRIGTCNPDLAQTPHEAGMVVTFLDGSVRTLRSDIAPEVYWGATTPNRGEIITLD